MSNSELSTVVRTRNDASATGFGAAVEGPYDAFVSYDTTRGNVTNEKHTGLVVACIAWCDALLAHATR